MTFPGPLLHGFHAALDVALWLAGLATGLGAVVLVLALLAWLLGVWNDRGEWAWGSHNDQVAAILADMDRIEAKANAVPVSAPPPSRETIRPSGGAGEVDPGRTAPDVSGARVRVARKDRP